MIAFTETGVEISREVCKALLAFTSKDETRPSINAIGFNKGDICATDGYTAVRFVSNNPRKQTLVGFSRKYADTQCKIAAAQKSSVVLAYENAPRTVFPPLDQVEAKEFKIQSSAPIGVNADYLSRLQLVCKACKGPNVRSIPPAQFFSLTGGLDCIGFVVDGTAEGGLRAIVTLMPVRLD